MIPAKAIENLRKMVRGKAKKIEPTATICSRLNYKMFQ